MRCIKQWLGSRALAFALRASAMVGRLASTPTRTTAMSGAACAVPSPVTTMPVSAGAYCAPRAEWAAHPVPAARASKIAKKKECFMPNFSIRGVT